MICLDKTIEAFSRLLLAFTNYLGGYEMKNLFIVIEGTDGSGKTSLVKGLKEEINNIHPEIKVLTLSLPHEGSFAYTKIREILKSNIKYPPDIVQSLFVANMIECADNIVNPFFKESDENHILILDRSLISTIVYNMVNNGDIFNSIIKYTGRENDINFDIINKSYCHLDKTVDYTFFLMPPFKILMEHAKNRSSKEKNDRSDLVILHQHCYLAFYQFLVCTSRLSGTYKYLTACKENKQKYIALSKWNNSISESENYNNIRKEVLEKIKI